MKRPIRLLPSVMLVCAGLLVVKTSGLMHDAYALDGGQDAIADAPKPANPDFAGADDQMASAVQVDVLTSLSKRRAALDAQAAQIQVQANMLAATEQRVDAKIAQLQALQTQINGLLSARDAAQEKQVAALVKTYSAMKPKDAARIFASLDDSVLVPVAQEMKSDVLAPVLAAMPPDAAQKLTVKLADRLALPDTADAAVTGGPSAAAATPMPATTPQTASPQTASPQTASPQTASPQAANGAPAPAPAAKPAPQKG